MKSRRWLTPMVLLATLVLAAVAIRWADSDFLRRDPPGGYAHNGSRPDWVWAMNRPYRRLQNAWVWVGVSATIGMAALVALDGRRRRPLPAGSTIVLVALAIGLFSAATLLYVAPAGFIRNGICSSLHDTLSFKVPGAILGTWAVNWGRRVDWRGKLVTLVWLVEVGFLIAYGLVFG